METDNKVIERFTKGKWWKEGLSWGLFMFVLMGVLYPWLVGDGLSLQSVGMALPLWLLGGLGYGYSMHLFFRKKIAQLTAEKAAATKSTATPRKALSFNQKTILIILMLLLSMGVYFFVKSLARPEQWRMLASSVSLLGFGVLTLLYIQHLREETKK
jgi:predicted membrane channel-forming protein YqfA (hemolysin III family)